MIYLAVVQMITFCLTLIRDEFRENFFIELKFRE